MSPHKKKNGKYAWKTKKWNFWITGSRMLFQYVMYGKQQQYQITLFHENKFILRLCWWNEWKVKDEKKKTLTTYK